MGTLIAFYVRTKDEAAPTIIREMFPAGRIEAGPEFLSVTLGDDAFEPQTDLLAKLSSELNTDVIWLSFQSTVDAFEFHHWQAGKVTRSLVFGVYQSERTWERVEGVPEAWEREAFFSQKALDIALKCVRTDVEKRELERIWRETELAPSHTEPSLDSSECAWKVAEYYHFPGWS